LENLRYKGAKERIEAGECSAEEWEEPDSGLEKIKIGL
jgi:hypothetical protein